MSKKGEPLILVNFYSQPFYLIIPLVSVICFTWNANQKGVLPKRCPNCLLAFRNIIPRQIRYSSLVDSGSLGKSIIQEHLKDWSGHAQS